ncbi:MAG: hypothetical protein ACR2QV_11370 [Gammaproteobacteria bacterium]
MKTRSLLAAGALLAAPAFADDIELFVSTNNQPFQCEAPNVLFLIDTSGSMDDPVNTQADWDPAQSYSGCFAADSFYFNTAGTPPECGATILFNKSANRCDAINNTEYSGEFQAWDDVAERWVKLADADSDFYVECKADEGNHGSGANDETYGIDGSEGPWSADGTNRIAWGSAASVGTVYDGNWLNWLENPPTVRKSRLQIVKEVTKATLDNLTGVNVGLMEFNDDHGGQMLVAAEDIKVSRDAMKLAVDDLRPGGGTPLSESLYELGQYLRGGLIDFGTAPNGESVAESRIGGVLTSGQYQTPLTSPGQNTYIVLLTDGDPSSDDKNANRLIEGLPGYNTLVGEPCDDADPGSCLDSMAEYLFKADLRSDVEGQQNVITHTIGFQIDLELLESTAERGGGKYFIADNTASLTSVLSNLAEDFARTASLLTPPQIPVNFFNQSELLNDVYVSLFRPEASQHWPGNLKRYQLQKTANGTILVDANGNNAIDPRTGFFAEGAVSFWTDPEVDGGLVRLGGAANKLPDPTSRNLYSNLRGTGGLQSVDTANTDVTAALVGAPAAERNATIDWALGIDSRDADEDGDTTELRNAMGDPLHVQPVLVPYGPNEQSPNAVIFVATNDGYLHAVDAVSGVELWAFIPRRQLSRLYGLSLETPAVNKEYGLDGELRYIEIGSTKLLVFGMRRGGDGLYAMNITNRTTPTLEWVIDGGDPDFQDLGQTWSPVEVAKVAVGGSSGDVLIFSGGYDAGQDNTDFRVDAKGNAIYMVDALTGDLLWSAGDDNALDTHDLELDRMEFSIPAGVQVLDTNRDGLADRMYFGDMGAQVWRVDLVNGQSRANLGEGGVLASVGAADSGTPARADARRFYSKPDVVNVIADDKIFVAINIGSGYRAHPLDTEIDEEFFSIRDFRSQEVVPTADYGSPAQPIISRADLLDITDDLQPVLLPTDPGWRLRMEGPGEKILSSALTISNTLFFNSFTPTGNNNTCLPGGGRNILYVVDILDGSALTNLDQSSDPDNLTKEDRSTPVGRAQDVPLDLTLGPDAVPCVGLDCFTPDDGDDDGDDDDDDGIGGVLPDSRAKKTYWFPVARP